MLQIENRAELLQPSLHKSPSPEDLLAAYLKFLKRSYPLILAVAGLTVALGLTYVFVAAPRFTATATMIIDTRKVQLFQQQQMISDMAVDTSMIESQVELLRSDNIALSVIRDLRLTEDPEFVGSSGGLIGAIVQPLLSLFGGGEAAQSEFELQRKALDRFKQALAIRRVGQAYVMEISFTALSSSKAAQIANAVGEAYIVDQLEAKFQATKRASVWLQDRIGELRKQATTAEQAVVDYKAKNNIVESSGRLISDQQLAETTSQLVAARAATAEAKARLDRVEEIRRANVPDATVADTLRNEVVTRLRQQYTELANREANWSMRYGRDHLAAVNLRNQMREIEANIADELKRISESMKSDFEIAKARQDSLEQSFNGAIGQSLTSTQAQVTLRELESSAQTYRSLHDGFLQRYMESVQQQSFPITEARVISPALPPLLKSSPKTLLILAASILGGLMLGVGAGVFRQLSDRVFRSSGQVEHDLGLNCLSLVPQMDVGRDLNAGQQPADTVPKTITRSGGVEAFVLNAPLSHFAESVRALKVAVDLNSFAAGCKVVGVTSAVANEGKSTIAFCLAELIAMSGSKVLLIDGDLRNSSLSRDYAPGADAGLIQTVLGQNQLDDVVWTDPRTSLSFLPVFAPAPLANTSEYLSSASFEQLIEEAKKRFNYIIIDLPPLAPVVDVQVTTRVIDQYLMIVKWGQTKIDVVQQALWSARGVSTKMVGVVLNQVDLKRLRRYDEFHGSYESYGYYK